MPNSNLGWSRNQSLVLTKVLLYWHRHSHGDYFACLQKKYTLQSGCITSKKHLVLIYCKPRCPEMQTVGGEPRGETGDPLLVSRPSLKSICITQHLQLFPNEFTSNLPQGPGADRQKALNYYNRHQISQVQLSKFTNHLSSDQKWQIWQLLNNVSWWWIILKYSFCVLNGIPYEITHNQHLF